MSTLVDERVVEMRFDNSNFERNTRQTMSSLQKLKASLNFSGVSNSIKSFTMDPVVSSLATAEKSFSAWEIASITTISNITNRIVDLGVQLVKSLSVDNITAGWAKFTEQTKTTGTIISQLVNTTGSLEEAGEITSEYMEKLQWYSDATSYSLTDMTSAISKFIGKGEEMDASFKAAVGIANWAASAGKNAQEAQIAFNALSKVADHVLARQWTSIQLGTMDTLEFKNAVLEAAVAEGTLTKSTERLDGTVEYLTKKGNTVTATNFTEAFADEWFNTEVLMKVLGNYGSAVDEVMQLQEDMDYETPYEALDAYVEKMNDAKDAAIAEGDATAQAAAEMALFSAKAFKSASEARTLEDALNAVKDAVSTGWLSAFQKIIGEYSEATEFFSDFADVLTGIFTAPTNAINSALKKWRGYTDDVIAEQEKISDSEKKLAELRTKYSEATDSAIKEQLQTEIDATEASIKKEKEFLDILIKVSDHRIDLFGNKGKDNQGAFWNLTDILEKLIKVATEAWKTVFKVKGTLGDFTKSLQERTLKALIFVNEHAESLTNIFKGLFSILKLGTKIFEGVKVAITPIINAIVGDSGGILNALGKIGAKFANWVENTQIFLKIGQKIAYVLDYIISTLRELKIIDRISESFKNFFKGMNIGPIFADLFKSVGKLFSSALDIFLNVLGNVLNIAAKYIIPAVSNIVKYLGILAGVIGGILVKTIGLLSDALSYLFNKIKNSETIQNGWKNFVAFLQSIPDRLRNLSPFFIKLGTKIASFFKVVWNALKVFGMTIAQAFKLRELGDLFAIIGEKIAYGFHKVVDGIKSVMSNKVPQAVDKIEEGMSPLARFFKGLVDLFKGILAIIKALLPLIGRILSAIGALFQTMANSIEKTFTKDIKAGEGFKINWGAILSGGIIALLSKLVMDFIAIFKGVTAGLYSMFDGIGGWFRGKQIREMALAMKEFAISILLFVGALLILSMMDTAKLWKAMGALGTIVTVMTFILLTMAKFAKTSSKLKIDKSGLSLQSNGMTSMASTILAMGVAMLIIASALKVVDSIDPDKVWMEVGIMATMMGALAFAVGIMNFIGYLGKKAENYKEGIRGIKGVIGFAISLWLMAKIVEKFAAMPGTVLAKGITAVGFLGLIFASMVRIMNGLKAKGVSKMAVFAAALTTMVLPIQILGEMKFTNLVQALAAIYSISLCYTAISLATSKMTVKTLVIFAGMMVMLRFALEYLSNLINSDAIKNMEVGSLVKFGVIFASLVVSMIAIYKAVDILIKAGAGKADQMKGMLVFSAMLAAIVSSMIGFAFAATLLNSVSWGTVLKSVYMLGVLIAATVATILAVQAAFKNVYSMSEFYKDLMAFGIVMAGLVATMYGIAGALRLMPKSSFQKSIAIIQVLAAMLGATILVIYTAMKMLKGVRLNRLYRELAVFGTVIGVLVLVLYNIAAALRLMSGVSVTAVVGSILMLATLVTATALVIGAAKKIKINSSTVASLGTLGVVMLFISSLMLALAGVAKMMHGVDGEDIKKTLLVLSVTLASVIGTVILASIFRSKINDVSTSLLILAAAFLTFGLAAITFAKGLKLLASNAKGLIIFAGALAVMAVASKLMTGALPTILSIAAAFGIMGLSVLGLGAGIYFIVQALNELLPNLDALSTKADQIETVMASLITGVVKGISEALPEVISSLMQALDIVLQNIGIRLMAVFDFLANLDVDKVMEIVDNLLVLVFRVIDSLLEKLGENIGPIIDKLITILINAINALTARLPELMQALADFVIGFIEALGQTIDNNSERIADAMVSFCKHLWNAFLTFFGIKNGSSSKSSTGAGNIITGIITGIGKGVSKAVKALADLMKKMWSSVSDWPKKFLSFGKDIIQGIWNGIKSVSTGFTNFFKNLFSGLVNWFKKKFGINSPSKLMYEYGGYIVEGLQNGIDDGEDKLYDSMEGMYNTAIDSTDDNMYDEAGKKIDQAVAEAIYYNSGVIYDTFVKIIKESIANIETFADEFNNVIYEIAKVIEEGIPEDDLVITPVMDLSDIQNKTALAAAMLSTLNGYSVSASNNLAEKTANEITTASKNNVISSTANSQSVTATPTGNGNYNFTFNIYDVNDPKVLFEQFNQILQHELGKNR